MGEQQIVTRLRPEETVDPPARIPLHLEIGKMHFFDKETGVVIRGE